MVAAFAMSAFAGSIDIDNARGFYMEDAVNGARIEIYMDIVNMGDTADRLFAVRSKHADHATLNTAAHDMAGGTIDHDEGMHMPTTTIAIPAGETVTLKHGGMHVMLMKPTTDLAVGTTITVILFFEQAGKMEVLITLAEMDESHAGEHKQH
jgi:copper(I)-binding protein